MSRYDTAMDTRLAEELGATLRATLDPGHVDVGGVHRSTLVKSRRARTRRTVVRGAAAAVVLALPAVVAVGLSRHDGSPDVPATRSSAPSLTPSRTPTTASPTDSPSPTATGTPSGSPSGTPSGSGAATGTETGGGVGAGKGTHRARTTRDVEAEKQAFLAEARLDPDTPLVMIGDAAPATSLLPMKPLGSARDSGTTRRLAVVRGQQCDSGRVPPRYHLPDGGREWYWWGSGEGAPDLSLTVTVWEPGTASARLAEIAANRGACRFAHVGDLHEVSAPKIAGADEVWAATYTDLDPWRYGLVVARFGDTLVAVGVEGLPDVDEAADVAGRYAAAVAAQVARDAT